MTWAYQFIIKTVIANQAAQMCTYPGKGNETAAPPVDYNQGDVVIEYLVGGAGRDFVFVEGYLSILSIALWRNKKF